MIDTPVTHIHKLYSEMKESDIRGFLGRFGLTGKTQTQKIQLLSGGQKSRVVLATISLKSPHLLFLGKFDISTVVIKLNI